MISFYAEKQNERIMPKDKMKEIQNLNLFFIKKGQNDSKSLLQKKDQIKHETFVEENKTDILYSLKWFIFGVLQLFKDFAQFDFQKVYVHFDNFYFNFFFNYSSIIRYKADADIAVLAIAITN